MILILILVLLLVLKLADVWIFASMSWWWIAGIGLFAFLWFEFFERMLGLDKRRKHQHYEKIREERVKRTFEKKKNRH